MISKKKKFLILIALQILFSNLIRIYVLISNDISFVTIQQYLKLFFTKSVSISNHIIVIQSEIFSYPGSAMLLYLV